MVKTQVQIPDHLYEEAKRIAEEYEMSFAEVVRRGLERMLPAYPKRSKRSKPWALPTIDVGLRKDPFANPDWREETNRSSAAGRIVDGAYGAARK